MTVALDTGSMFVVVGRETVVMVTVVGGSDVTARVAYGDGTNVTRLLGGEYLLRFFFPYSHFVEWLLFRCLYLSREDHRNYK